MVVRPNIENKNLSLRGTWKREGNNIIAKLKDPDGEVEAHEPRFEKQKEE